MGFYLDAGEGTRHVNLGRRLLPNGAWDIIEFADYNQTADDGHNTISIGISEDGKIHLSWDMHSSQFHYRHSLTDLANSPETISRSTEAFSPALDALPGSAEVGKLLSQVRPPPYEAHHQACYPRFLSVPQSGSFLLEIRTGISGKGDDWLSSYKDGEWHPLGPYLKGENKNTYVYSNHTQQLTEDYINGMDVGPDGCIHVTWCYRDYVPATLEQSAQHAGPNGPENVSFGADAADGQNHELHYAYSPIENGSPGRYWYSSDGVQLGESCPGLQPSVRTLQMEIPKCSGVLNQEAQVVDEYGTVHVLNRETVRGEANW